MDRCSLGGSRHEAKRPRATSRRNGPNNRVLHEPNLQLRNEKRRQLKRRQGITVLDYEYKRFASAIPTADITQPEKELMSPCLSLPTSVPMEAAGRPVAHGPVACSPIPGFEKLRVT